MSVIDLTESVFDTNVPEYAFCKFVINSILLVGESVKSFLLQENATKLSLFTIFSPHVSHMYQLLVY
jgi:hypothetical protein